MALPPNFGATDILPRVAGARADMVMLHLIRNFISWRLSDEFLI